VYFAVLCILCMVTMIIYIIVNMCNMWSAAKNTGPRSVLIRSIDAVGQVGLTSDQFTHIIYFNYFVFM